MLNAIQQHQREEISSNLAAYKERGQVNYLAVIKNIPLADRLPALVQKYSKQKIVAALTVSLTACFEKMNLRYGVNADQLVELADMVIETSEEDQLSLEDVLLFLEKLLRAEMGKIYDRMDIPTFFEMFEKYRQQRHEDWLHYQEEQHAQFKALGTNDRIVRNYQPSFKETGNEGERAEQLRALKDFLITKLAEEENGK